MRKFRKLLLPFAWLYGWIVWLRNKCFDWGWLSSKKYDFPVVCVGNLSIGGTGKSPMIEYLVSLLGDNNDLATLSRGYKRKTTGFYLLKGDETAAQVGDEPLQFKIKYPQLSVAVCENRQEGNAHLRKMHPRPEVILLDDAFQHRRVNPGGSILLTAYGSLYADDVMLPAGNLREPVSGAQRAQIVVVSKCPIDISDKEKQHIQHQLQLRPFQSLYFSTIRYADFLTNGQQKLRLEDLDEFCLVTGIAKPGPLLNYLDNNNVGFVHRKFPDHHHFTE